MGYERRFGKSVRARRENTRERRGRFLLVLGGITTEKEYFLAVGKSLAATGLQIDTVYEGWNPRRLVEEARNLQQQDARQAKKDGDPRDVFDAIWVVIDVDEFAREIAELRNELRGDKLKLAVSNPCFETWAVLHGDDQFSAPCERGSVQSEAKKRGLIDRANGKSLVWPAWEGRFEVAAQRAAQLRQRHATSGAQFPANNPSTDVDIVVRTLIESAVAANPEYAHSL